MFGSKKTVQPTTEFAYAGVRKLMKPGKSKEQCHCIDFLVRPNAAFYKKGCACFKDFGVMKMSEYIDLVQKHIDSMNLKERAIAKIGLDESQISEIPPIVISRFEFKGDENIYVQSEESKVRGLYNHVSNIYKVTWIFFSATQIYTYTYCFDSISDNSTETTRDFFYGDITCIRTEHEVEELIVRRGCACFGAKYVHANREYDSLQITVPNDSYSFICRTNDTIEQSVQAAKAMIREKKGL